MNELLIGLISLVIAIFFGLIGFRSFLRREIELGIRNCMILDLKCVRDAVREVEKCLISMRDALNDFRRITHPGHDVKSPYDRTSDEHCTVEVRFKNLGRTRISADLDENEIVMRYTITFENGITTYMIEKAIEELRLEKVKISCVSRNTISCIVLSRDSEVCTTIIARLLKWLDLNYYKLMEEFRKEYEEKILEKLKEDLDKVDPSLP